MPKHHTFLNRDDNEAALVELWKSLGCIWIQQPRENGFDGLLVCPRTGLHIVEIKNPAYKWTLTPSERARCTEVEGVGSVYSIIENEKQALELVGMG